MYTIKVEPIIVSIGDTPHGCCARITAQKENNNNITPLRILQQLKYRLSLGKHPRFRFAYWSGEYSNTLVTCLRKRYQM